MASPFSIFRKHQKSLMVVLVIGSMIAFTGESLFTSGQQSWPLLGAMLGIAIALIAGFQFGRPVPYAVGGLLIGGLLGFLGPSIVGQSGMQTKLGTFDEERYSELIAKRTVANDFVSAVRQRAGRFGGNPFQLVQGNIQRDVMLGEALRAEADEMGIYIDDNAVNDFIDNQTGGKLSTDDFVEVRKMVRINNLPVSEDDLYNLLRDEIKAKVALETLIPFRPMDAITPDSYWDLYQRMNVRQQVSFAQVDVDNFLDEVGEPSDAEVTAMFEKYQDKFPNLEPGSPGFYQERRMKLAYVEVDFVEIEAGIPESTNEEIQKYYDENKDLQFRKTVVPEDPEDDFNDEELDKLDKLEKEAFPDEIPGGVKTPGTPEAGETPEAVKPESEAGTEEAANSDAGDSDAGDGDAGDGDRADGDGGCGPAQDDDPETTEETAVEPAQTTTPPPADPAQTEDAVPTLPSLKLQIPESGEATGADPFQEPPVEYMPLDADLRSKIADSVKLEKAFTEANSRISAALEEMKRLSGKRDERFLPGATDEAITDVQICEELKKFADANGLAYAETPLATGRELLDRQEYPIGSATQPSTEFSARQPSVVQILFGGGGGAALFLPSRAELAALEFDGSTNQYAYWVIGDVPPHMPALEEDGMRERVIKAWKRQQARPVAKERAEKIAAQVRTQLAEEVGMSDILKDVTQSGNDDTAKLVVTESLSFSWMRTSSAPNPMGMRTEQAQLTQLEGVTAINDDFMKYIFTELEPNEVGVTPNGDLSAYYVVQPLNRFPTDDADRESAMEGFLKTNHFDIFNSAMPGLVQQQFGQENNGWLRKLEAKYNFNFGLGI